MTTPKYTLEKIKFATDAPTYKKACALYESDKVTHFDDNGFTYTAKVAGTKIYHVVVDTKYYDRSSCDCYLGKNDTLCKHMVAVAIYAVLRGAKIPLDNQEKLTSPVCSNKVGTLSADELASVKKSISDASRLIKAYAGPSRTWFVYQNSLAEGVSRLSITVSKLPIGLQTAELLVALIIRLDRKLVTGGVDDSDGTVGGFIEGVVQILLEFAKQDPQTIKSFKKLLNIVD